LPLRAHRPTPEDLQRIYGGNMGCVGRLQSCANGECCCLGYECLTNYKGEKLCDMP
jgi:hypothetical protein